MAENNKNTQAASQNMAGNGSAVAPQQPRPCPKDCSQCSLGHQVYCTAKMTFDSFAVMNAIIQRLDQQSEHIARLEERISSLQSSESAFSSPAPVQGELFADKG